MAGKKNAFFDTRTQNIYTLNRFWEFIKFKFPKGFARLGASQGLFGQI